MSPAYEDLSSTEIPLSIFPLANDYLMSGHCERDKCDSRRWNFRPDTRNERQWRQRKRL